MKCFLATIITSIAGTLLSTLGLFLNYRCCSGGDETALSSALGVLALPGLLAMGAFDRSGGFAGIAAFFAGNFLFWAIPGFFLGLLISRGKKQAP